MRVIDLEVRSRHDVIVALINKHRTANRNANIIFMLNSALLHEGVVNLHWFAQICSHFLHNFVPRPLGRKPGINAPQTDGFHVGLRCVAFRCGLAPDAYLLLP